MNQTKQEAAEAIFQEQISGYPESNRGDMMYGFDYGFQAGTKAAELKWIPVTERLPEDNGRYFCVTADDTWIVGEYEHNYIFCDPSGCSWRCKLWCPIPDSLLNFKP